MPKKIAAAQDAKKTKPIAATPPPAGTATKLKPMPQALPAARPARAGKAVKPAGKTPVKAPVPPAAWVKKPVDAESKPGKNADKPVKPRPKLVRDSFTMPESDFSLIGTLKTRALAARRHAKKSELLRAGLRALAAMDGKLLVDALNQLETVEVGRPKKGR